MEQIYKSEHVLISENPWHRLLNSPIFEHPPTQIRELFVLKFCVSINSLLTQVLLFQTGFQHCLLCFFSGIWYVCRK